MTEGMPERGELKEHDRIGFLLDLAAATFDSLPPLRPSAASKLAYSLCLRPCRMTVYLNGELKGVMAKPDMEGHVPAPLKGPLRWAADMQNVSVTVRTKPLPEPE